MDEAEGLECIDTRRLLRALKRKVHDRKYRLFACASARSVWHHVRAAGQDEPPHLEGVRRAVETAERHAEGLTRQGELAAAHAASLQAASTACPTLHELWGPAAAPVTGRISQGRESMSAQDRIDNLLLLWQERHSRGQALSAGELCRDCPELEPQLREQLHILRHMNALLGTGRPATSALAQPEQPAPAEGRAGEVLSPLTIAEQQALASGQTSDDRCAGVERTALPAVRVPGYEVVRELGRGGMGVVYLARQKGLGRLVALKMVLAGGHASSDELARFRVEADAIARLQHPNIVQVHEVGEHGVLPFFSLEFCPGGGLDRKLAGTPLPPAEAARLAQTLARAVQAAHDKGVVHRDLKPANVLLSEKGDPKVTDFGLARKIDEAGQTASGAIMGTPSYMAPEQARGQGKAIGPACDVYALGAILYECLTGRPPFKAATPLDTVLQVVSEEPVPPSRLQSLTPSDLETICLKCLAKEPPRRYATAQALAEDLRRWQAGEPITARPVGRLERGLKWVRRNPVVAALTTAVALVLVLGATVAGYFGYDARREAERANAKAEDARREAERADKEAALAEKETLRANEEARKQKEANIRLTKAMEDRDRESQARILQYRTALYVKDYDHAWECYRTSDIRKTLDILGPSNLPSEVRGWEWDYLNRQCKRKCRDFTGHTVLVLSVCFSPDGKRLASCGGEPALGGRTVIGEVKIWNAASGLVGLSPDGPERSGMLSTKGNSWLTSGTLAPVTVVASGMPWASVKTWCLVPNFPRSVGLGPVWSPPPRARALVLSMAARDQSIWSASWSSSSRT
jgi:hypothetical protein